MEKHLAQETDKTSLQTQKKAMERFQKEREVNSIKCCRVVTR